MRRLMVVTPAFVLVAVCGSSVAAHEPSPTKRPASVTEQSGGDSIPSQ